MAWYRMLCLALILLTPPSLVSAQPQPHTEVQPETERPPAVGDPAPPLSFDAVLSGRSVVNPTGFSWDEYAGRTIVLEFAATWCGPCIANIPHLNELVEAFADDDSVLFLTLSNERREQASVLTNKHGLKADLGWDADGSTFEAYWVDAIPFAAVVGPDGRIAALLHPANLTESAIRKIHAGDAVDIPMRTKAPRRRNWNQWGIEEADTAEHTQDKRTVVEAWLRAEDALDGMSHLDPSKGTIRMQGLPAARLIQDAWGVGSNEIEFEIDLPGEAYFTLYVDGPDGDLDAARHIAKALLEAHLGLRVEQQMKRQPALALAVVPGTPGPSLADGEPGGGTMMGGRLSFPAIRTASLASLLSKMLGQPVINQTGLNGVYEVDVEWDLASGREGLKDALRSIGLDLTEVEAEVQTIVVRGMTDR